MPYPSVAAPALAALGALLLPSLAAADEVASVPPRPDAPNTSDARPAAPPGAPPAARLDATAGELGRDLPQPFQIGPQPAWFLLGGLSSGYTAAGVDDRGAFVGGELSLVRLLSGRTMGLYADAYYDFGADGTYASFGPELGWMFVALDGGLAARFAGETDLGATGRLCLTAGVFSLCGRYTHFFEAENDSGVLQFGALLKMPLMSPGGYR